MKQILVIATIFLVILAIAIIIIFISKEETISEENNNKIVSSYSIEEVKNGNTPKNCLIIYEESVYKIPEEWQRNHPGGSMNILDNCGKDVTTVFKSSHTGDRAILELEKYFVGKLN